MTFKYDSVMFKSFFFCIDGLLISPSISCLVGQKSIDNESCRPHRNKSGNRNTVITRLPYPSDRNKHVE